MKFSPQLVLFKAGYFPFLTPGRLMEVLSLMKADIVKRVNNAEDDDKGSLTKKLENYIQTRLRK